MDKKLEPIVQALQEKFSTSLEEFRNEVHVFVNLEQIVEALTLLRDKYDFELLSAMTASDYLPQMSPRFHVIYQLSSLARNITIQLRVPVDGTDPKIPTATGVYEVANWRERTRHSRWKSNVIGTSRSCRRRRLPTITHAARMMRSANTWRF